MSQAVVLDTHAFLWYATDNAALSSRARAAIVTAGDAFVSAASAREARTKYRLGKLPEAAAIANDIPGAINRLELTFLSITVWDGDLAGGFPQAHRDPFDRMLAAQSIRRDLALVSNDPALDAFGVTRVW